jgi:hypothetical protein
MTGVPLEQQPGSYKHIQMAEDALSRTGPANIESVLPFVRAMVDNNWLCIQRLACTLLDRRALDYDEVVRLIQAA